MDSGGMYVNPVHALRKVLEVSWSPYHPLQQYQPLDAFMERLQNCVDSGGTEFKVCSNSHLLVRYRYIIPS